jgi:hydroxylamine reductase
MYCYQCEQTFGGKGCTEIGVCGKDATTAALQDLLLYAAKGVAMYAHRARAAGAKDLEVDEFVVEALFTTVTNVNFDPERMKAMVDHAAGVLSKAKALYEAAAAIPESLNGPALWKPAATIEGLVEQAKDVAVTERLAAQGEDVTGLQELVTYGLKGTAAYAHHALMLGKSDDGIFAALHEGLDSLVSGPQDVHTLVARSLWVGELNLKVMALLDEANTGAYGHPEPTRVRITPVKGKCIAVSGHDLKDLEELLKQTEGKGINVYTHGEMLPANAYPGLKKYKHLVGNFGGAWQIQGREFSAFPGAILMTTNCIQRPAEGYKGRIFTSGLVAWPEVTHIADRNFTPVIEAALAAPGYAEDVPEKTILTGFARNSLMAAAGAVIDAVKSGALKHIFLIGGCDGAKPGRNYYTEFAQAVPKDCVILTLACGKYRFNKLEFGDIGGIPRLLDVGQCNDAYSAIVVASELAKAFGCGVNDLPLSLVLSWYEQKAVAILLTLLHLGLKNIRLGPTLPAFVTPAILNVLVENFNVMPITTVEQDMAAILA